MKHFFFHPLRLVSLSLLLSLLFTCRALAQDWTDDSNVTVVKDREGSIVFSISSSVSEGDEYISSKNIRYQIIEVKEGAAVAQKICTEVMPDVSWLETGTVQAVFADEPVVLTAKNTSSNNKKLIALYVTHSDESYIPSDGTQSIEGQGGIYDVAREFRDSLQNLGIDVILDESTHLPHDSGAYRRSRQTAERLIKHMPDAIIDIHRDGIPDAEEYKVTLDGENASQIRLLVGRANQNSAVNREFAKEIKAIADKQYPGLIKDIFIGKGTYNQDLSPNAILLEFGTHTISKERVLNSVDEIAHVVSTSLYGEQTGSAKSEEAVKAEQKQENKGASKGIVWMIIIAAVLIGIFALAQTGSLGGMKNKIGRGVSEITGGLIGKRSGRNK